MQTLHFTTHIGSNAEISLTLPAEYANQNVELVVVIQAQKQVSNTIETPDNKNISTEAL